MDADAFPLFVPPPLPPLAPFAGPCPPAAELELHFNTLFMLEAEKGRAHDSKWQHHNAAPTSGYDDCQATYDNLDKYLPAKDTYRACKYDDTSSQSYSSTSYPQSSSDWQQSGRSDDCFSDLWLAEKSFAKDDDVFFDSNYTGRLTPDSISGDILPLPPLETAFSNKHFGRFERDASIPQNGVTCNNLDLYLTPDESRALTIDNLDGYCYPSNTYSNTPESSKHLEYAELFDKITFEDKADNFDFGLKVFDNEGAGAAGATNESDSLLEDLGCLDYYNEEDSELADLVQQCGQGAAPAVVPLEAIDTDSLQLDDKDDRICFWKSCEMLFPNQTTLVDHIERVHVNTYKGEEFSCLWSACARGARPFNARYKLLIHMRVHSGHKPNQCAFPGCGKAFSRLENLKIHRRSHTGERPYRCQAPRCSKAFSNSSDRAKHQRTHFNARPYACQIEGCSKRYTDPSSLRKHVKNHMDPTSRTSAKLHAEHAARAREHAVLAPAPRGSRAVAGALQQKISRSRLASRAGGDLPQLDVGLPDLDSYVQQQLNIGYYD